MAHSTTPDTTRTSRFAAFGKKLAALAVSYEIATYALATVQAAGLTLPTMVNPAPAVMRTTCQRNMQDILRAAGEWKESHPGFQLHRPQLAELKPYLNEIPRCPQGGVYEMVYPGHTLRLQGTDTVVVPNNRIAVRCVHEHEVDSEHGGIMATQYPD